MSRKYPIAIDVYRLYNQQDFSKPNSSYIIYSDAEYNSITANLFNGKHRVVERKPIFKELKGNVFKRFWHVAPKWVIATAVYLLGLFTKEDLLKFLKYLQKIVLKETQ